MNVCFILAITNKSLKIKNIQFYRLQWAIDSLELCKRRENTLVLSKEVNWEFFCIKQPFSYCKCNAGNKDGLGNSSSSDSSDLSLLDYWWFSAMQYSLCGQEFLNLKISKWFLKEVNPEAFFCGRKKQLPGKCHKFWKHKRKYLSENAGNFCNNWLIINL